MGIAFKDLIKGKEIEINELEGKTLVIDTYNLLYQFLSSIRSIDGSLLADSKGNITSHLVGLFSRVTNLMSYNIKLVFVFDGIPPKLKEQEREKRKSAKIEAQKEYEKAKKEQDLEQMKKYASRTSRLTPDMIKDAKTLISLLGLPIIQAPSEGEAQAVFTVKQSELHSNSRGFENQGFSNKEKCFAVVSQDYDSLLYGTPYLVRNLSIAGKRKQADKLNYTIVKPEIIDLSDQLKELGLNQEQLIILAILIGTDYNPGGIKGIGPKTALTLVKKYKSDFDNLFKEAKWNDFFEFSWKEIYNLFKNMPVTCDYTLEWNPVDNEKLKKFLLDHDFSEERIDSTLLKLEKTKKIKQQKSIMDF